MNRYFFNFRKGDEVSRDYLGMYLEDLDAARAEALQTCRDLSLVAEVCGEACCAGELEIADASGEPVLVLPVRPRLH